MLVENHPMLEVLAHAGFEFTQHPDHGVVSREPEHHEHPGVQSAADRREFQAQSRSLAPLLAPRSVAVAGVRSDGTGVGAAVLDPSWQRVRRPGGRRPSQARCVSGVRAYPSFSDLPDPVDLAVIAVPAESTALRLKTRPRPGYGRR